MIFQWHWRMFSEISQGRTQNGWGPTPLSWLDINAWSTVSGVRLSALDLQILRHLDSLLLDAHGENQDRLNKKRAKKAEGHPSDEKVVRKGGPR